MSLARATSAVRSDAAGAMTAQLWQAAGSFGLQVLAAHLLGASGLGTFALCFGLVIVGTAVVSGVVGDSLTVLDRHDRRLRAGLQWWCVVLIGASALLGPAVLLATGLLTPLQAALFGVATAAFQVEEILRRLLMAELRFWRLVVVDTAALGATLACVAATAAVGPVTLSSLLLSLVVGQTVGCLVAHRLASPVERRLVSLRGAGVTSVIAFGGWRGAQVAVNPAVLTLFRSLVIAAAGVSALGDVEAARILVAPAILLVQGLGSYLLASYARDRGAPLTRLVARANRAALVMSAGIVVAGVAVALLVPRIGFLVAGRGITVSAVTVICWSLYAAASAGLQPYASLCAARGRPRQVFLVRLADSAVALGLAAVGLVLLGLPTSVAPAALAVGLVCGGVLVRLLVLRPLLAAESLGALPDDAPRAADVRSGLVTRTPAVTP